MDLQYLDFEISEDGEGGASFDALASVPASRWPQLAAEVARVLGWAGAQLGACAAVDEGGDWDYALHGTRETSTPMEVRFDPRASLVTAHETDAPSEPRITLGLTVTCAPGAAQGFRDELCPDPR